MLDKLSTQKRLIIATVISVLFFIVYDAFLAPKRPLDINKTIEQNQSAPATKTETNQAPAPKQTSKTIATIDGATYTATIDELGRIVIPKEIRKMHAVGFEPTSTPVQ